MQQTFSGAPESTKPNGKEQTSVPTFRVEPGNRAAAQRTFRIATSTALAALTALLLSLSFPDFNLWPLAWVAFIPLLLILAVDQKPWRSLACGWLTGSLFFYITCYWLTYSMIHYGGLRPWQAYLLLIPGPLVCGLFPALFSLVLARALKRWGTTALFLAPALWVTFEWLRFSVTGQLWNALGYSQAFHPGLIQVARFGGVYAVGFLILAVNAAATCALVQRTTRAFAGAALVIVAVAAILFLSGNKSAVDSPLTQPGLTIVALQPNVPMEP